MLAMAKPPAMHFDCPHCGAAYKLVHLETDAIMPEEQLDCRACGGPLQGREGRFILKYFLVNRDR